MTRRAANIDANQPSIVEAFRKAGATVEHLHGVGAGCPDLLVGYRGLNLLVEVKDGSLTPSKRKLSDRQILWHSQWRGQVAVVEAVEQALTLLVEAAP